MQYICTASKFEVKHHSISFKIDVCPSVTKFGMWKRMERRRERTSWDWSLHYWYSLIRTSLTSDKWLVNTLDLSAQIPLNISYESLTGDYYNLSTISCQSYSEYSERIFFVQILTHANMRISCILRRNSNYFV